jgi:hypothetical protein
LTRTFLLTAAMLFAIGATAADAAMMAYKGGLARAVQDEGRAKPASNDQTEALGGPDTRGAKPKSTAVVPADGIKKGN